eukprot:243416_1
MSQRTKPQYGNDDVLQLMEITHHHVIIDNDEHENSDSEIIDEDELDVILNDELDVILNDAIAIPRSASIPFFNRYIVTRICLLLLSILLIIICTINSFAQINEPYLKDFICPNKSLSDIYENSRLNNFTGGTNEGCWSSKGININNKVLFSSSNQPFDSKFNYSINNIIKSSIFGVFALLLFVSFCYFHIFVFIRDTFRYYSGYYINYVPHLLELDRNSCSKHKEKCLDSKCGKCVERLFGEDRCLWITQLILSEIIEISLQTIVCLKYNGMYIVLNINQLKIDINKGDFSLAEKREFVLLFAFIIGFNCMFTGFFWILYTINNEKYHGKTFKNMLFVIDSMFDFLYVTFPFIIGIWNTREFDKNLFDTLRVGAVTIRSDSWINFCSSLYPIIILSYRLCWGIKDVIKTSQRYWIDHYNEALQPMDPSPSISHSLPQINHSEIQIKLKLQVKPLLNTDIDEYINEKCCCFLICSGRNVLDKNFSSNQLKQKYQDIELCDDDIIKLVFKYTKQQIMRRVILMLFAILLMIFGFMFIILCLYHFYIYSPNICNNTSNRQLIWQKSCVYKVYPFTFIKSDHLSNIPCQCRILDIDLNYYHPHIVHNILNIIFKDSYMLQAVKVIGTPASNIEINIDKGILYSATQLRVFDVEHLTIHGLNDNIIAWQSQLEYFRISFCHLSSFPSSLALSNLAKLKYLNLEYDLLSDIDLNWLCTMKELKHLIIPGNSFITPFPSCIYENLLYLKEIDISSNHGSFNYHYFALPYLRQFVGYDTDSVTATFPFNSSFDYNQNTTYYLDSNIFCDMYNNDSANVSIYTKQFLDETKACNPICARGMNEISNKYFICSPLKLQNGICDRSCNNHACGYDGGDCNQLCAENCIESMWNSMIIDSYNECHEECNTTQCQWDFESCSEDYASNNYSLCEAMTDCEYEWIGDDICDDSCNVDICDFDRMDCNRCDDESICDTARTIFEWMTEGDMVWSEQQICSKWDVLPGVNIQRDDPTKLYNCTQMMEWVDLDKNGVLNAYESILAYGGLWINEKQRTSKMYQVNCSLCAPSIETYYYPWNASQIKYYTTNAPQIAFSSLYVEAN